MMRAKRMYGARLDETDGALFEAQPGATHADKLRFLLHRDAIENVITEGISARLERMLNRDLLSASHAPETDGETVETVSKTEFRVVLGVVMDALARVTPDQQTKTQIQVMRKQILAGELGK